VVRNGPAPPWAGVLPPVLFAGWVGQVTAGVGFVCGEDHVLGLVGVRRRVRE